MNLKIIFSSKFKRNYNNILNYLNELFPNTKNRFNTNLSQKIQFIKIFPNMYPKLTKSGLLRKISINKYIILYVIVNDHIILVDIKHEKSKFFNNQD